MSDEGGQGKVPGPPHGSEIKGREAALNRDAPHFKGRECHQKMGLEGDNWFIVRLLDIDEIEDIAQRVDCPRWVEVVLEVVNPLKTLAVESCFTNEEI